MTSTRLGFTGVVTLSLVFVLGLAGAAHASEVLCMSRTVDNLNTPINLRKARPAATVRVWGAAGLVTAGDGTGIGEPYTWSFACTGSVTVNSINPPLTGLITNDKYVVEEVSFTLNAGTRETCTATLNVGGAIAGSCTVDIDIIDPANPPTNTPLLNQDIDRQISVEEGLLYLYLTQAGDGSWPGSFYGAGGTCAATGFSIWAFHINHHLPPSSPNTIPGDIYARIVDDGRNYLFSTEIVSGTFALNADVPREAVAPQTSDCNVNARSIRLCKDDPFSYGYSHAIAAAGILTSDDPSITSRIEDYIDFTGVSQTTGGSGRGGWDYAGPSGFRGDGSVDAWEIRLLEAAEICYDPCNAGEAPDWILQEYERESVSHQTNAAGPQPGGYDTASPYVDGFATTAAILTGLVAIELENTTVPGAAVINVQPNPLNSIQEKRDAALDYTGSVWGNTANSNLLGFANRGNFYSMGTNCIANRLTERAGWHSVNPDGFLLNGGVLFDWETGEEVPGSGVLAAPNTAREGYISFLNRTQQLDGRWDDGTYLGTSLETPLALICETTETVLCPQELATATPVGPTPTPSATPTVPIPLPTATATGVPLNHFQCYEVHHPAFSRPGVSLNDAFGPGTVDVSKPKRFCAPADKNDEDPTAPQDPDHLAGYKIKQRTPAFTKLRDQTVVNQFGSQIVDVLKPELLLVPSAKDLSGTPPPLNPAVVNHFKCHKVRGKFRRPGVKVDDQFIGTLTVDLLKPVRLCLRADKNGEGVIEPSDALMCYKVRRPSFAAPPGTVFVNNQFEAGPFALFRPTEFCVPSQVNPGSQPTSTPVHTATPTPIQTPSLQCCGPFDQCIDADGTASAGDGIPGAVEVLIGNPLTPFPAVFNNSGLHMYDNDGNAMWTFGPAGDDLIAEGPTFCPTGIHNGVYDLGLDCKVLDYDGSLFNGQIVDCDLEEGAFCMPPLPRPIEFHDTNLNGAWDDGEDIVLDMNGNGICD